MCVCCVSFPNAGSITQLLDEYWQSMFLMGGLGGLPFSGKTGFAAFSHHAPEVRLASAWAYFAFFFFLVPNRTHACMEILVHFCAW